MADFTLSFAMLKDTTTPAPEDILLTADLALLITSGNSVSCGMANMYLTTPSGFVAKQCMLGNFSPGFVLGRIFGMKTNDPADNVGIAWDNARGAFFKNANDYIGWRTIMT